jgi:hypothetical protein
VIANGCLRKEARREHLDYINKGLLSKPNQGAKLALAYCDNCTPSTSMSSSLLLF